MAAYASTVTLYTKAAQRISRTLGVLAGQINITNYNSTTTEETDITRHFRTSGVSGISKGIISLVVVSSENGYNFSFIKDTGKFKVFQQSALAITNISMAAVDVTAVTTAPISGYFVQVNSNVTSAVNAAAGTAAGLAEVANDVDVGTADFVAIGYIGSGH